MPGASPNSPNQPFRPDYNFGKKKHEEPATSVHIDVSKKHCILYICLKNIFYTTFMYISKTTFYRIFSGHDIFK